MSSPSFTPASPSTPQHSRAATMTTSNATDTAATQTAQQPDTPPDSDDPTQRSTGYDSMPLNNRWTPGYRRSRVKAEMEQQHPELLQYYKDRRTGKIKERSFEEWGDMDWEEQMKWYQIENSKVKHVFFGVDYDNGFTGRGVLPEAMARPGLVGPMDETVDQRRDATRWSTNEQVDRPLWRANDGPSQAPAETELEEDEIAGPEDTDQLEQLAAQAVGMMRSGATADIRDASSPHTATTPLTEAQTSSISSYTPLTSTSCTPSRKRAIDAEEEAKDEDSPSQQKRRRMDDVLGIVRNSGNATRELQSVGVATVPAVQQSRKRAMSPDDDHAANKQSQKRQHLYKHIKEVYDAQRQYIPDEHADTTTSGHSSVVCQDPWSDKARLAAIADEASAHSEAISTPTEWDTLHGINSYGANIRVPKKKVIDVTGEKTHFYLPKSSGSPDQRWTDEEKETLRSYIQDYRIRNWAALSESMNRTKLELQFIYVEIVATGNLQAGRPELAGIPEGYPDLAPSPPPSAPEPAAPPAAEEIEKRQPQPRECKGKTKISQFGDLTYDAKAKSFPRITRDGGMVDAKGNVLLGVMGNIPYAAEHRQSKPKQQVPTPAAQETTEASTKGPLRLRFTGVHKLLGSSRRGVPRNAPGLRKC